MLIRIVKLTFKEESLDFFFSEFNKNKSQIVNFPGCKGMKLLQDIKQKKIIMTYSQWDDEKALNDYRSSEVFSNLWNKIKIHFSDRTEAWSHAIYFDGFDDIENSLK
mgnify:FL=1